MLDNIKFHTAVCKTIARQLRDERNEARDAKRQRKNYAPKHVSTNK